MVNVLNPTEDAYMRWLLTEDEEEQQDLELEMLIQTAMQQKLILEQCRYKDGIYRTDH